MTNKELLELFFLAENERNWGKYMEFLSEEIEWRLYAIDGSCERIVGKDAYLVRIKTAYQDSSVHFQIESLTESDHRQRMIAMLIDDNGKKSCDIFDFSDGKIIREYEYLLNK